MKAKHFVTIKPRFSDFNLQGIMKGSLYFDFVCEAQLAMLGSRYGIDFKKYAEANQKWNISEYSITFHEEMRSLSQFIVCADVKSVENSTKNISFSVWSEDKEKQYASGTITFDLYDVVKKQFVVISTEDKARLLS